MAVHKKLTRVVLSSNMFKAKLGNLNQYAVLDGFQQSELINTVLNSKAGQLLKEQVLQVAKLIWAYMEIQGLLTDHSYHPSEGNGHGFINVGYMAFIGGLMGMLATKLGISEIGAAFANTSFGEMSCMGMPFVFLLWDILHFDYMIDDAINCMINSCHTCNLMLGVGNGKLNEFHGFQYSYSVLNIFNNLNLKPNNSTWHPKIKDIVYWGMDWICPAYNCLLSKLLIQHHSQITAEVSIHYISTMEQSNIAFYNLPNMKMYMSFTSPFSVTGPAPAYARQYTAWDVDRLLAKLK